MHNYDNNIIKLGSLSNSDKFIVSGNCFNCKVELRKSEKNVCKKQIVLKNRSCDKMGFDLVYKHKLRNVKIRHRKVFANRF